MAQAFVYFIFLYLLVGLALYLFLILSNGLKKIDATTEGATTGFKIIILPAICGLWPVVLRSWLKPKLHD